MIIGAHSIIYSTEPDSDRAFLSDVLKLSHVDVGDGMTDRRQDGSGGGELRPEMGEVAEPDLAPVREPGDASSLDDLHGGNLER